MSVAPQDEKFADYLTNCYVTYDSLSASFMGRSTITHEMRQ